MKKIEEFVESVRDIVNTKDSEERKEKIKAAQKEFFNGLETVSKNIEERRKEIKKSFDTDNSTGHGFNVRDILNRKSDE